MYYFFQEIRPRRGLFSAMLSLASAAVGFTAPGLVPVSTPRANAAVMETVSDLKAMAEKLNPTVGYYNPTVRLLIHSICCPNQEASSCASH
jgi:hypothetical protein